MAPTLPTFENKSACTFSQKHSQKFRRGDMQICGNPRLFKCFGLVWTSAGDKRQGRSEFLNDFKLFPAKILRDKS
jgi:hypothetical protein